MSLPGLCVIFCEKGVDPPAKVEVLRNFIVCGWLISVLQRRELERTSVGVEHQTSRLGVGQLVGDGDEPVRFSEKHGFTG